MMREYFLQFWLRFGSTNIHAFVNCLTVCTYNFDTAFKTKKTAAAEERSDKGSLSCCSWRKQNDNGNVTLTAAAVQYDTELRQ